MSRVALLGLILVVGCFESRLIGDPIDDTGVSDVPERDASSDVFDADPPDAGDADVRDTDPDARDSEPADADPSDTEPSDTEPSDTEPSDTEPSDTGARDTNAPDTFRPPPTTCRVTPTALPRCTAQAEQCLVECSEDGSVDESCAASCHETVDECLDCRLTERFRCLEDFVCVDELQTYMCCLRDCGTSRPPLLRGDGSAECAARECTELEDTLNRCLIGRPEVAEACDSRALRVCGFR